MNQILLTHAIEEAKHCWRKYENNYCRHFQNFLSNEFGYTDYHSSFLTFL